MNFTSASVKAESWNAGTLGTAVEAWPGSARLNNGRSLRLGCQRWLPGRLIPAR
jgi:hypothetical protein